MGFLKGFAPAVVVLVLFPHEGFAQTLPAHRIAELAPLVDAHPEIVVTLDSGERLKGRLDAIDVSKLSVRKDNATRWVQESDVTHIEQRTRDSLLNGLLIGAGIGGVLFLRYYSHNALCQYNCQFVSGGLFMIGAGAGIGAAVDALKPLRKTIFVRSPRPQ